MTTQAAIPGGEWSEKIPDFARRIGAAARARRAALFGSPAGGETGKDGAWNRAHKSPHLIPPRA